jgi:pimeloyl-ACP methyl ester carboxylesterase
MKTNPVFTKPLAVAALLLAVFAINSGETAARNAPNDWILNPTNGHYYKEIWCECQSYINSWDYCQELAVAENAHLVTIKDSSEQSWLQQTFMYTDTSLSSWYWIGLIDEIKEGNWVWITGEPTTYTNWWSGQPSEGNIDDVAVMDLWFPSPDYPFFGYWFRSDKNACEGPNAAIIEQGLDQPPLIGGRVTDANNNPVPNVTVVADSNSGNSITTQTDVNGYYTFTNAISATYTLSPSLSGYTFSPITRTVTVPPGATARNFKGYNKPPIVFVTGLNYINGFTCNQADPDSTFEGVDQALGASGYYTAYARLRSSFCYTPPFNENVPYLQQAIEQAKANTSQPKVILVAHSMGGLVSRAYIEDPYLYRDDVEAFFSFGSPHEGTNIDLVAYLANGASLGQFCAYQSGICEMTRLQMFLFNSNHYPKWYKVDYHATGGDSSLFDATALGWATKALIYGNDDGIVPTNSAIGLDGHIDRWTTDEAHNSSLGINTYFTRTNTASHLSQSYWSCLQPVLVAHVRDYCNPNGPSLAHSLAYSEETEPDLTQHTPFEFSVLQPGQVVTYPSSLEGGFTLFASQWQSGTIAFTLVDPNLQVIDPAYAAANPSVVLYTADAHTATYYFSNAISGTWHSVLQPVVVPAEGSPYGTFVAVDSNVTLSGNADKLWYAPGLTATITVTLSGSPLGATVTADVFRADGLTDTVTFMPTGGGEFQSSYLIPNAPGYTEVRLVAAGVTTTGLSFERGTSLAFQISPNSFALAGIYSDTPQPRSPDSPFYQALTVTVGINSNISGMVGLTANLVDGYGNFVAHSFATQDVATGTATIALRYEGDDIFASQHNGPYRLTGLLLTDQTSLPLVVTEADDVYTTAAYKYSQFAMEGYYIFLPLILR